MQNLTLFTCAFAFIPALLLSIVARYLLERLQGRFGNALSSKHYTANSGASTHITSADPLLPTVTKESDFPESWWTGDEVFELEKRAIFDKGGIIKEGLTPQFFDYPK